MLFSNQGSMQLSISKTYFFDGAIGAVVALWHKGPGVRFNER